MGITELRHSYDHGVHLSALQCSKQGLTTLYDEEYTRKSRGDHSRWFGTIQALYVFFSRSTSRSGKLVSTIPITVKSESETRWSSRAEALKPVSKYLDELLDLLHNMIEDADETPETRSDARNL
ncbi:hypothetical protein AVEN_28245-1 [Araneus ventricosus]|uniref:Uncharacterized protein n=1 Tax=Araneus ventricosus TaxID=182803 RepID=A0A4Y2U4C3_ARAVE|nr:hypothetical protein AVEN_28245-1 [Araneus ventricosus]